MSTITLSRIRPKWGLITLFIIWLFLITGVFYVVQKPLSIAALASLAGGSPFVFSGPAVGNTLLNLLAGLWLWLLSFGLGLWLYRWLGLTDPQAGKLASLETIIFSTGLGCGALGWFVLGLGLLGLLSQPVLYGLTIALTLVVAPQTINYLRKVRFSLPSFPVSLFLLLTLGLALTIALLPPTDWDGLFYHLTGPKLYLQAGAIRPGIDIPHLNFPSLFEMLFTLGLAIWGEIAAKLFHFLFSLLLAGLVYTIAKRQLGLKYGWFAVLFLFSMPMVVTLAGWAYNDLALAFFQVAAMYAAVQWYRLRVEDEPPQAVAGRWLILSGVFCGLAMSLKYTSFVAPVTVAGLLLWWQSRKRLPARQILKTLLVFSLTAGLIALPWYLKNWVFTGNPVYPFVFDGLFWDDYRKAAYSGAGSGIGFAPLEWLSLPFYLTLGINDANYIDGRTGPLFLAFLPLILVYSLFRYRPPLPQALQALLIFALAQYLFWMVGVIWSSALWQSRLLLPALVALCPVLAWILDDLRHLNHPQFSLHHFLTLMIALVLLLGLVDQLFSGDHRLSEARRSGWVFYKPLHHLAGTETQAAYLERRLGVHAAAMSEINTGFPQDAVVAFLWEPRSYYCHLDCRPDSILDEYGHLQYLYGQDADAIRQAWHQKGISHVLVHRLGFNFLLSDENVTPELRPDPNVLADLEMNHFELIFDVAGAYQGYRLK